MDNKEDIRLEEVSSTQKKTAHQELSKIIGRYGIEMVLESFIELTDPCNNNSEFPEVADLHSRLVMAVKTYKKSYESRESRQKNKLI